MPHHLFFFRDAMVGAWKELVLLFTFPAGDFAWSGPAKLMLPLP